MGLAALLGGVGQQHEVGDVLRDDDSTLALRSGEDLIVSERSQFAPLRHCAHVVPTPA